MNPGVSCLIDGDDLKHGLGRSGRRKSPAFKLALRSGVFQGELSRKPGPPVTPLSPYFEFVCIPETSGSERAPSEHLDFRPDLNLFSLLQNAAETGFRIFTINPSSSMMTPSPSIFFPGIRVTVFEPL